MKPADAADARRGRLLAAAKQLFFAHGFTDVTTDMIARDASVSKATIYRHFASKDAIFAEVIQEESRKFAAGSPENFESEEEFRQTLTTFGERALALIFDPAKIRFERLILQHADAHPRGAELFHENAHRSTLERLTTIISSGQSAGFARDDIRATQLADYLLSMWKGMYHGACQLGVDPITPIDTGVRVQEAIDILFPTGTKS
ncbi:MAG: TetR/AcrR family transcriptional regulator [Pacificimonas sp.]